MLHRLTPRARTHNIQAETEMQKANVHKVMKEIGLETDPDTQHLEVWNKIDLMGAPTLFSSTFDGLDALTTPTKRPTSDAARLDSLVTTQRVLGKRIFPISARTGASERFYRARAPIAHLCLPFRRGVR